MVGYEPAARKCILCARETGEHLAECSRGLDTVTDHCVVTGCKNIVDYVTSHCTEKHSVHPSCRRSLSCYVKKAHKVHSLDSKTHR